MTFTFDVTTNTGKVRLLIPDRTDALEGLPIYQDEEIDAFLSIEGGNVKLATALAVESLASDIAQTDKVIRLLDLQTDGAKTLDSLLKRCAKLREQTYGDDVSDWFDFQEFSDLTDPNAVEWHIKNEEVC